MLKDVSANLQMVIKKGNWQMLFEILDGNILLLMTLLRIQQGSLLCKVQNLQKTSDYRINIVYKYCAYKIL